MARRAKKPKKPAKPPEVTLTDRSNPVTMRGNIEQSFVRFMLGEKPVLIEAYQKPNGKYILKITSNRIGDSLVILPETSNRIIVEVIGYDE